jgi:hypothetical protein
MKKDTVAAKLNALFGDAFVKKVEEVKTKTTGKVVGISEEEIQEFREAQGILYFLEAPALFTYKVCGHCGADFFVSRLNVKFCSYSCIKLELQKQGFEWRKGNDIEALIADPQVYNGNEPIWISSQSLQSIREMVKSLPENLTHSPPDKPSYSSLTESKPEPSSSSNSTDSIGSMSPPITTTSGTKKVTFKIS